MSKRFVEVLACCVAFMLAGCGATAPDLHSELAAGAPSTQTEVDKRSQALFEQALTAIRSERYQDAESLLKELTARDPALSGPWVNLGSVYEALGDDESAQSAYKRAIDANPANCAAYVDLGVLERREGDFASAEAYYLACIQHVPDFREAYLNLGILYDLYLGRLDDALKAYQQYQALSSAPDTRVSGWVSDLERRIAGNES